MGVDWLLDTCTFMWTVAAPEKLSARAKKELGRQSAELCLSDVSVWEISLKWEIGKIRLPEPPRQWIERQCDTWSLRRVPIECSHLYRAIELPPYHRDPFDRLLVAQAIELGLVVVTPDDAIRRYPVGSKW